MPTVRLFQSGDGNALKAICDGSQPGRIAEFGEARGYTRADLIALAASGATMAVTVSYP